MSSEDKQSMNLNGKTFRATSNSETGEVSSATSFKYFEEDGLVWAEYSGGDILKGNLIGTRDVDGSLDLRYQHVNRRGEIKTGICRSTLETNSDGKIRIKEKWQWTCADNSEGESEIVED
jgi:hypothetical protein